MTLLQLLIVLAVVGLAGMLAVGKLQGGLPPAESSLPLVVLPEQPTADDLREVKFSVGLRGYRMSEVDQVLTVVQTHLGHQAETISQLQAELAQVYATATATATSPASASAEPGLFADFANPALPSPSNPALPPPSAPTPAEPGLFADFANPALPPPPAPFTAAPKPAMEFLPPPVTQSPWLTPPEAGAKPSQPWSADPTSETGS